MQIIELVRVRTLCPSRLVLASPPPPLVVVGLLFSRRGLLFVRFGWWCLALLPLVLSAVARHL